MGTAHAASGLLAGLLVGRALGYDELGEVAPFAIATAGYAIVPDLDHRSSSATRLLGPITGVLSLMLRKASTSLYAVTKGPKDEPKGEHRHLTHTLMFALVLGGICAATSIASPWVPLGWLAFGAVLTIDRLGVVGLAGTLLGAGTWLVAAATAPGGFEAAFWASVHSTTGWLGLAVALGCFVHCLGDAITSAGCPFLFPLYLRGETWYELRPPRWLRFKAGGRVERLAVMPALIVATVLAIPGVLPAAVALLDGTTHV